MKTLIFGLAASALCAGLIAQPANAQNPAQPQDPTSMVHADAGVVQLHGAPVPINQSMGANAGEIVNVRNGQATITFNNGCSVKVEGRQYTIPSKAPACHTAAIPVAGDGKIVALGVAGAVAVGLAVGSGGSGKSERPSSP
ncbi:hypothetical protein [Cognatiluteimonas profundi]|uniref:hypothetical protein n=1 Tax=Cognatiluteimonas profundi TaxID=2594501 RepID=UPI00131DE04E|nr:hypothetical protein [Lysobacter profundi]